MSYDDRDSMINRVLPLDLRVRRVDPRAKVLYMLLMRRRG